MKRIKSNGRFRVFNQDCLIGMKGLKEHCIDCVICDLPYGVLNKKSKGGKWDTPLPLDELWQQYERIVKPDGAVILFGQGMFTASLMLSNPKRWRYNLIWDKGRKTQFLNARRMPMREHEDICVFYQKQPKYTPQLYKCLPEERTHARKADYTFKQSGCYGNYYGAEQTGRSEYKWPGSILRIPKEHKKGEFFHPTQKPVDLMRWLIRTYTSERDIVLDNTMGSGSTGVAAILEGRRFVGYETDDRYFDIAVQRLEKACENKSM